MSAGRQGTRVKHSVVRIGPLEAVAAYLPANARRSRLDLQVTNGIPVLVRFDIKVLQDGGDIVMSAGEVLQFHDPAPVSAVSFYNPDAVSDALVACVEGTREEAP